MSLVLRLFLVVFFPFYCNHNESDKFHTEAFKQTVKKKRQAAGSIP
jgi:hypothetical protein